MIAVGLDVALEALPWGPARIGLLTHRAAVSADGRPACQALLEGGARIVRLLSPEHGLNASAPAGATVTSGTDVASGLPVVSLYGARRQPNGEDLEGLEAIAVDLQDVGARCYTYASTTILTLRAAAAPGCRCGSSIGRTRWAGIWSRECCVSRSWSRSWPAADPDPSRSDAG